MNERVEAETIDGQPVRGDGRYLVFGGSEHYPSGGAEDFALRTDSLEAAKLRAHELAAGGCNWSNIFDLSENRMIYRAKS